MTTSFQLLAHPLLPFAVCLLLTLTACDKLDENGFDDAQTDTGSTDFGVDAPDTSPDQSELDTVDAEIDTNSQVVSSSFKVRASVEQLAIWSARPDTQLEVLGPDGELFTTGTTDSLGSLIFRDVPAGDGYMVRLADEPSDYTDLLDVMTVEGSLPDESFYADQVLEPGFGYLTTRDGTTLSIFVSLPGPVEDGPYPTIVNYSGYSPSRPGRPIDGASLFCGVYPILCDAPDFASGLILGLQGYASVGVNMRGTACSGGAYYFFEPLQLLDGYDAVEIVAHQSWVKNNKVGMAGLSYPGIAQLYVASTNPPSLAAISPMSVVANTGASTMVPGGILNAGFALEWIVNVLDRAVPYGDQWVRDVVDAGDGVCEENQLLHSQRIDVVEKIYDHPFYNDEDYLPLDATRFAERINVPVFLVGQFEDEQTGGHFPALFDKFTQAPITRFTATNGVHIDGFSPQILEEWFNFMAFYVGGDLPKVDATFRALVPTFMDQVYGASMDFPEDRFALYASFDEAKADYEAEDPVRIIFESGANPAVDPGAPQGRFEKTFASWPLPETVATRWYFQPDGSLADSLPSADGGASSFELDPEAGDRIFLASGSVDPVQPDYDYRPLIEGKALAFLSPPLTEDTVMVGHASVDLWLQTSAPDGDADLEVTLTEVRPDGKENFIQNGWLRASQRALAADATELRPIQTHREADAAPLVAGEWNSVRVEMFPFSHVFRAGSQIRISVDTPGDNTARWRFLLNAYDVPPVHSVAHQEAFPSSILLPVIPGIEVSTALPDCHALRGQPCRDYVPLTNPPMP